MTNSKLIHLTLVRHGQTVANVKKIIQGHSDTPLTKLGLEQAELLGKFLNMSGHNRFDRVYASNQGRAVTTCKAICSEIEFPIHSIMKDCRLSERKYGKYEGKLIQEFQLEAYNHGYNKSNFTLYTPDEVESMESVIVRAQDFLRSLCHECESGDRVLVVTHWGLIKELIKTLEPFANGSINRNHLIESPNAAFSQFELECEGASLSRIEGDFIASVRVICLHQSPHLMDDQTSFNIEQPLY